MKLLSYYSKMSFNKRESADKPHIKSKLHLFKHL